MAGDYTELLCSLPHLADPFKYQRQSISLVQLQKRMTMLQYEDYVWMKRFRPLFYWTDIPLEADEATLTRRASRFIDETDCPDIKSWMLWRMDIRTIVAAMRRRISGEAQPVGTHWGYGRYLHHIQAHWSAPCFNLENRYTFLPEAHKHLVSGESFLLEKTLLKAIWDYCDTRAPQNQYGFAAVVLYMMKWNMIDQWTQYNSEAAVKRFNDLVSACLPAALDI